VLKGVRDKGRPILLFHHTSTSPIRQIPKPIAQQFVREIIENSDYFVVSADKLDYRHDRFMCLANYSQNLDRFAGIISLVDAIITVDTSTYHLADAFDKPTIVLFTSIEPDHRIRYYPHVRGIMLEEEGGPIYGQHKLSKDKGEGRKQMVHVNDLWNSVKIPDVLRNIERVT
jgi:ADP-heptose:LPS heptosyltransferase